jgi:hypothetical protein
MDKVYAVLDVHVRRINKMCGSFQKIGLKRYKSYSDSKYDLTQEEYNDLYDWYSFYIVEDEIKFKYGLIKYPELYKLLSKDR